MSYLRVPFEYMWTMLIWKSLQNLQVTKIGKWDEMTLFQEDMLAAPHVPQVWANVLE